MDRCLQQSKGRESEFSSCKIFNDFVLGYWPQISGQNMYIRMPVCHFSPDVINAATNENENIFDTENGPMRTTGVWS